MACAKKAAARFEVHLCRMERLSRTSAMGWLAAFGGLRDARLDAVVSSAWNRIVEQLCGDFRAFEEKDGSFVHFTTRLHNMTRSQIHGSISYEALMAYDPALPPDALPSLKRFVAENRRYWHENPRTRELVPIKKTNRLVSNLALRDSLDLMDPAALVSLSSTNAVDMAAMVKEGTLHTLGRDVFYYETRWVPQTSTESRRRAREWRRRLRQASGTGPAQRRAPQPSQSSEKTIAAKSEILDAVERSE